jgi:hypothetical protein
MNRMVMKTVCFGNTAARLPPIVRSMKTNRLILGVLAPLAFAASVQAELVVEDGLLNEYKRTARSIAAGEKRGDTLARLQQQIEQHPQSPHLAIATRLTRDLAASIERATARMKAGESMDDAPARFLSESKLPLALLAFPENWGPPLHEFMTKNPRDPAVLLFKQGRESIDSLLPQLSDDAPTRAFDSDSPGDGIPEVPRVSDIALNLIEAISQCKFFSADRTPSYFHRTNAEARDRTIQHIALWWRANKDKSVAEGIRAQLPHAGFYDQIKMAQNLIRVAGESRPPDREHGLEVLRRLARSADYQGSHAANALAKYGDLSPVEWYYAELTKALPARREWTFTIGALFYLAEHGGRKEWELLYAIAGSDASLLGSLLNAPNAKKSPLAIPLLGLALSETTVTGSRWVNETIGGQSVSKADQAAEFLQKQTGIEFGYRVEGTPQERTAAIERAQKWWAEEGRAKYSFDYIEGNLIQRGAAKDKTP